MRKRFIHLLFIILIFLLSSSAGIVHSSPLQNFKQKTGTIKGTVVDAEVKSPLPQVKIKVLGLERETMTDEEGKFAFYEVPVGYYTLEFSSRFYTTLRKTDIIVKSQRTTWVDAELQLAQSFREKEEITVTAGYFSSTEKEPTSISNFSFEEIRRLAVPAGDVSRILSTLPSVVSVNAMQNTLTVRGGSPAENSFYVDNMEIPNINHYPQLGSTAGAIGLLNIDFIRDVHFYSGGFSPRYGDSLSSIMDIRFREGNQDKHIFQLGLDMMGASVVGEGPIYKNTGSWMFSARRSYLDLLIKLMGQGVPVEYIDYQGKINIDLSPSHRLSFLGIGGIDHSGTQKEDALRDKESYYGGLDTKEYTWGINWFSMWGSSGYSKTSISQSYIQYKDYYYHTVSEELAREGKNSEKALTWRNINHFRLNQTNEISFGLEWKHLTNNYDYFLAGYTDVLGQQVPSISRDVQISEDMYTAFFNWSWSPFSSLDLNTGMRMTYWSLSKNLHLSPRFSLSYKLSKNTSLQASAGIFGQHLPLHLLHQVETPERLHDPLAYHFILGISHLLTQSTRMSIEIYDKEYHHFPLDPDQPKLFIFDEIFYQGFVKEHQRIVDTGRGRAKGVEVMIQKKLVDRLYGVISGSYFQTGYRGLDGVWRNRVYDNRFIFSLQGGYKFNKNWECSWKWILAGGYPYTPFDLEASEQANTGVYDQNRINQKRLLPIHYLNLRMDKRFYFGKSNLILYLTLWNVYNHKNVISRYWNTIEEKPDQVELWGILPCLGLEFEF